METKLNLNSILLILVLVAFVIGTIVFVVSMRSLLRPLQRAEEVLEKQFRLPEPTPTIIPDPVTVVHQVQSLSRLEGAAYSVEKVITAETGQGPFAFLFGDRLILVAHGEVIAGVDLDKLEEGDVVIIDPETVVVTLPAAEVFVATLDNEQSYVYDRDTGVIGLNPDLETAARQAAEEEILNAALEDGILEMAQENAEATVRRLVLSLGFEQVLFQPSPTPTPTPTATP